MICQKEERIADGTMRTRVMVQGPSNEQVLAYHVEVKAWKDVNRKIVKGTMCEDASYRSREPRSKGERFF